MEAPTQSTRTDLAPKVDQFALQRAECKQKGGRWDDKNNVCILPEVVPEIQTLANPQAQQQKPTEAAKAPLTAPEVFKNQAGRQSGIDLPDGRTFLGLGPSDVNKIAADELKKTQTPEGTAAVGTAQAKQQQIMQNAAVQQILASNPLLTEQDILKAVPQENFIENVQATGAGIGGAILGASKGAAIGAFAGPVGSVVGGTIGAAIGGLIGSYSVITIDKRQDVRQASKVGTLAVQNIIQTTNALNAGLIDKKTALERFNNDKVSLYAARVNLKRDTESDLKRFVSGGADELAKIEDQVKDLESIYTQDFAAALVLPNPANIKIVPQESSPESSGFLG